MIWSYVFPERWTYSDTEHRTGIVNQAALLIYQINSSLEHKKNPDQND
jgi:hypothetical protein